MWVDWLHAERFANWMHNDQTAGGTEYGAYKLNEKFSEIGIVRNANAKFWIPSESEWYKATYFAASNDPSKYWMYPTQSDAVPEKSLADAAGIGLSEGVGNSANYGKGAYVVTNVGTNGGPSPYGAFDMWGNAEEWNDTEWGVPTSGIGAVYECGVRGSDFLNSAAYLVATVRAGAAQATFEDMTFGFRLASPV